MAGLQTGSQLVSTTDQTMAGVSLWHLSPYPLEERNRDEPDAINEDWIPRREGLGPSRGVVTDGTSGLNPTETPHMPAMASRYMQDSRGKMEAAQKALAGSARGRDLPGSLSLWPTTVIQPQRQKSMANQRQAPRGHEGMRECPTGHYSTWPGAT